MNALQHEFASYLSFAPIGIHALAKIAPAAQSMTYGEIRDTMTGIVANGHAAEVEDKWSITPAGMNAIQAYENANPE